MDSGVEAGWRGAVWLGWRGAVRAVVQWCSEAVFCHCEGLRAVAWCSEVSP